MVRQDFPSFKMQRTSLLTEDLKNIVENTISSYEARIQSIESILEPIHQILDTFQQPYLETKQEQQIANLQLRESLSKNSHLRYKDFDQMMQGIVLTQDEKEKVARSLLVSYLNDQKEMVYALKDNLTKVRDAISNGQLDKIKEFHGVIKEMFACAQKRKEEVTSKLKELQEEQAQVLSRVKVLLAKGNELRIKDFKEMLREFKIQHQLRIAQKLERKVEVRSMLADFKKKRMQWRKQKKIPPVTTTVDTDKENKVCNGINIEVQKKTGNEEIPPKSGGI